MSAGGEGSFSLRVRSGKSHFVGRRRYKKARRPEDPAGGKPLAKGVSGRLDSCAVITMLNLVRMSMHQPSDSSLRRKPVGGLFCGIKHVIKGGS